LTIKDLLVDELNQFAERVKSIEITGFRLEMAVEGLLVAVLPRSTFRAHGELGAKAMN
jgi:hypothetical protein